MKNKILRQIAMLSKWTLYGFLAQLIFASVLIAAEGQAQAVKSVRENYIKIEFKNNSIIEAFNKIERKTGYSFAFEKNEISKNFKLNRKYDGETTVSEILLDISKETDLKFKQINKSIIVSEKNQKSPQNIEVIIQGIEITGKITDENGGGLPGVNILVKSTNIGTVTDIEGEYILEVPSSESIVVFSSVGYVSEEKVVGTQTVINIALIPDVTSLDELVVIGYGTQKKKDLTGAVASVGEDVIEARPVATFEDAIKGRMSGVQVRQTGGDLAGDFSISVRGVGSVNGSNDPLIVVDGVPLFSSNFSTINPKDIQSMDVLKDASATAIYGARAANGVIIITTKKGNKGKLRLTLDVDLGFENIVNKYDLMTTEQQRELFVEAFTNSNRSTAVYDDPTHEAWQVNTDWQDLGTRTAFRQGYNLGFGGGSENTDYSGSFSYLNREGTLINTELQQYSLRLNVNSRFNKWLKLSTNLNGSYQGQDIVPNDSWGSAGFRSLSFQHSYTEPYDEDGNLTAVNTTAAPYFGANGNPLIDILLPTRRSNVSRILGNTKLDVTLTDGLTLSGNVGADIVMTDGYTFLPVYSIGRYSRAQGSVTVPTSQQINWVTDITLDYEKQFGDHNLKALAGFSAQQFHLTTASTTGSGTVDNGLNQLSNQTEFNANGADVTSGLVSYFGRVNYNYASKYYVTGTVRYDGSSKFGPENRYGVFPSGSVAWRISQESFLSSSSTVEDLKLRVGYGQTGNQDIGNFAFITKAGSTPYVFGNNLVVGNSPLNIGNPNLKWESNTQFNVGIDISLFKGRIFSTIDYYDKQSEDLLVSTPIPLTSGVAVDPIVNLGSIKNSGVEFALNTINIEGDFSWTTSFNISFNKNEVIDIGTNSLGDPLEIPGEQIPLSWTSANLTREGQPAASFYMYTYDGVWQLGEEDEATAWDGASPGDPKYADLNDNGVFDAGDKSFVGSPHPKYFGGMDNTFTYKNLSLSVFLEFAGGHQTYNTARNLLARGVPFVQNFAEANDFWTPENPSTTVPRPSQGGYTTSRTTLVSSRWLEDGDYLKIQNIRLSYDFPSGSFNSSLIESAKLTLTATNYFTFTNYKGLDPESSSRNNLLSAGLDFTPYPPTKLLSLSVQVNF